MRVSLLHIRLHHLHGGVRDHIGSGANQVCTVSFPLHGPGAIFHSFTITPHAMRGPPGPSFVGGSGPYLSSYSWITKALPSISRMVFSPSDRVTRLVTVYSDPFRSLSTERFLRSPRW